MNGAIIWEGVSRIDNKTPIVAIATGLERDSANIKTGAMVQVFIIRSDIAPLEAMMERSDAGICGGCPHRRQADGSRTCYVNVGQSVGAVFRAYQNGSYDRVALAGLPAVFADRLVRLGAYGDPAAVPSEIWTLVLSKAKGHTGYTHQWKAARLRDTAQFAQCSVDNEAEAYQATALGLGYFRVKAPGDRKLKGEIYCPAAKHPGVVTCSSCLLCSGKGKRIVIDVHGSGSKHFVTKGETK